MGKRIFLSNVLLALLIGTSAQQAFAQARATLPKPPEIDKTILAKTLADQPKLVIPRAPIERNQMPPKPELSKSVPVLADPPLKVETKENNKQSK